MRPSVLLVVLPTPLPMPRGRADTLWMARPRIQTDRQDSGSEWNILVDRYFAVVLPYCCFFFLMFVSFTQFAKLDIDQLCGTHSYQYRICKIFVQRLKHSSIVYYEHASCETHVSTELVNIPAVKSSIVCQPCDFFFFALRDERFEGSPSSI